MSYNDDNFGNRGPEGDEGPPEPVITPDNPFTRSRQLSEHPRKAARTSTLSTPGQRFTETLKSHTVSLPNPSLRGRVSAVTNAASKLELSRLSDISPTPGRFGDGTSLNSKRDSDLTTTVLELLHSDKVELRAVTEAQIRLEIGLKMDVDEIKLLRYEETISKLREKIDEMEATVMRSTGK